MNFEAINCLSFLKTPPLATPPSDHDKMFDQDHYDHVTGHLHYEIKAAQLILASSGVPQQNNVAIAKQFQTLEIPTPLELEYLNKISRHYRRVYFLPDDKVMLIFNSSIYVQQPNNSLTPWQHYQFSSCSIKHTALIQNNSQLVILYSNDEVEVVDINQIAPTSLVKLSLTDSRFVPFAEYPNHTEKLMLLSSQKRLYFLDTYSYKLTYFSNQGNIDCFSISTDGQKLAAITPGDVLTLWGLGGENARYLVLGDCPRGVHEVTFSPNSQTALIKLRNKRSFYICDLTAETIKLIPLKVEPTCPESVFFAGNGQKIVSVEKTQVRLLTLQDNFEYTTQIIAKFEKSLGIPCLFDNGRKLVLTTSLGIQVLDLEKPRKLFLPFFTRDQKNKFFHWSFPSPDGKKVALLSDHHKLQILDFSKNKQIPNFQLKFAIKLMLSGFKIK